MTAIAFGAAAPRRLSPNICHPKLHFESWKADVCFVSITLGQYRLMKIIFLRSAAVGSTFVGACLLAAGCGERATPVVEMRFGTTKFAFGVDGPAGDYVHDYHSKLPAAADACGVALLGFNGGITDGAEAAYFSSRGGAAITKTCLKQRIPNGTFEVIEHDSWERLKRANPNFPVPLAQMPPQFEVEEITVKPAK